MCVGVGSRNKSLCHCISKVSQSFMVEASKKQRRREFVFWMSTPLTQVTERGLSEWGEAAWCAHVVQALSSEDLVGSHIPPERLCAFMSSFSELSLITDRQACFPWVLLLEDSYTD